MKDNQESRSIRIVNAEPIIPYNIYINLQPRFASLPITIPHLRVDIPENPTLQPQSNMLVVKLKNNGRLKIDPHDPSELDGNDWEKGENGEWEWDGITYSGSELMVKRKELLEKYFETMLGGKNVVAQLKEIHETAGLKEGGYLYRAITQWELRDLERNGYKEVSFLDPSANFENEQMYNGDRSQVKQYVTQTEQDYSGKIIRWKIEHPLLYRRAGFNPPRIQPMFSHYLPIVIEISSDAGKTFSVISSPK